MNLYIAAAILIVGFLSRLLPHVWDFTPVLSLAVFSGAYLSGRQRYLVPLTLMIATDCILGFYPSVFVNWIGVMACVWVGTAARPNVSWVRVGAGSLGAAVVFYAISNFGVWLSDYPKTWAGFADCYILALPFFRNSLLSTVVYSYLLTGGYAWAVRFAAAKTTTIKN